MVNERFSQVLCGVGSGVAATVVYTWTSTRLKKRTATHDLGQPIQVAAALTGTASEQSDPSRRRLANTVLHWGYGIWGGLLRALLVRKGLTSWRADLAQLAVFWLPWRLVALAHRPDERPLRRERNTALFSDFGKHVVYVLTARFVHDLLARRTKQR